MTPANNFRSFYAEPGIITDAGSHTSLFFSLPEDVPTLCKVVQGLILHRDWAPYVGVNLDDNRKQETNLRTVQRQLERILQIDDSPLNVKRQREKRIIGTCRDFSTFLVAIMRAKGIPARARCGFGAYFTPGRYEDHWVVEYWNDQESRWIMVDAQIDGFQHAALKLDFDPLDMPPNRFFTAGKSWQMCRQGSADPEKFGIFDMHGLWFIAGNVVRDLLSLNKMELLPWDVWPVMHRWGPENQFKQEDFLWLDRVADLTLSGNDSFQKVRTFYLAEEKLREPPGWPDGESE